MRHKGIVHLSPGRKKVQTRSAWRLDPNRLQSCPSGQPPHEGCWDYNSVSYFGFKIWRGNEEFSTVSSLPKENSKTTFEFIPPNICPFFDKQLKFLPLGPTLCSLALLETEKQLQDLVTDLVCGSIAGKSLSWDFYAQLMTSQLLATAAVRMTTATNTR